jgi:cell division protein FtsB
MAENNELEPQPVSELPEPPEPVSVVDQTPEVDALETTPREETTPEPEVKHDEKAEKKPPTRFQLFLRKALIGLVIVALIFLAGFLTDHFVRYAPLADTLETTRAELEAANQAVSDLEAENTRLTGLNRTATNQIADLEAELSAVRANALFYQVLMDVNTARIALFMEDVEGAQSALADTQDNLEALLPAINDVDPDLALSLPRRLELIVSGLARDPETGLIDLELFTKDLLALEPLLAVD